MKLEKKFIECTTVLFLFLLQVYYSGLWCNETNFEKFWFCDKIQYWQSYTDCWGGYFQRRKVCLHFCHLLNSQWTRKFRKVQTKELFKYYTNMNQFHGLFVNIFHFLKANFFCKIDLFDFTSFVDLDFFKKTLNRRCVLLFWLFLEKWILFLFFTGITSVWNAIKTWSKSDRWFWNDKLCKANWDIPSENYPFWCSI